MNKDTIKLISYAILIYPKQVAKMLNDDGVVLEDASNFTTKELSDATVNGLTTSKKFNNDFVSFAKNMDVKNFMGADGYSNAFGDWGADAIKGLTELVTLNTKNQQVKGELDAQNRSNETALLLKDKDIELAKLKLLGGQQDLKNASAGKGGNTTLYVALGIGGALVLGLVIFLVTRKKS
jgi:hypothetical protein